MMETLEKIYLNKNNKTLLDILSVKDTERIEYIRTDAFIEKACAWLKESITNNPECNRILSKKGVITMGLLIEDFINYMKGE